MKTFLKIIFAFVALFATLSIAFVIQVHIKKAIVYKTAEGRPGVVLDYDTFGFGNSKYKVEIDGTEQLVKSISLCKVFEIGEEVEVFEGKNGKMIRHKMDIYLYVPIFFIGICLVSISCFMAMFFFTAKPYYTQCIYAMLGFFLIIVGVLLAAFSYFKFDEQKVFFANATQVEGTIEGFKKKPCKITKVGSSNKYADCYGRIITYTTLDGALLQYTESASSTKQKGAIGDSINVFYLNTKPTHVQLIDNNKSLRSNYLFIVIALVIFLLGVFLLETSLREIKMERGK